MDKNNPPEAYGVFKPVGHVVASFDDEGDAQAASAELRTAGFGGEDVIFYSADEMLHQADQEIAGAGVLATLGQELNLVKEQRELAERGSCFLVVKAPTDEATDRVTAIVTAHKATRAQKYGRLIIEELIEPGSGERQVAESPDRGIDAQTVSGREGDAPGKPGW